MLREDDSIYSEDAIAFGEASALRSTPCEDLGHFCFVVVVSHLGQAPQRSQGDVLNSPSFVIRSSEAEGEGEERELHGFILVALAENSHLKIGKPVSSHLTSQQSLSGAGSLVML